MGTTATFYISQIMVYTSSVSLTAAFCDKKGNAEVPVGGFAAQTGTEHAFDILQPGT